VIVETMSVKPGQEGKKQKHVYDLGGVRQAWPDVVEEGLSRATMEPTRRQSLFALSQAVILVEERSTVRKAHKLWRPPVYFTLDGTGAALWLTVNGYDKDLGLIGLGAVGLGLLRTH